MARGGSDRPISSTLPGSSKQRILSALGKPFSVACLGLVIFTPLWSGRIVSVASSPLFVLGSAGMIILDYTRQCCGCPQPQKVRSHHVNAGKERLPPAASQQAGSCHGRPHRAPLANLRAGRTRGVRARQVCTLAIDMLYLEGSWQTRCSGEVDDQAPRSRRRQHRFGQDLPN
jgi:hypothetical protein